MIKKNFTLVILVFLASLLSAYGQINNKITIRPYLRAGINLLPPSMEDLEYIGDWSDADINKNPINIGLGTQLKLALNKVDVGIDIGGGTMFRNEVIYDEGVGVSSYLDKESHIYVLFFGEYIIKDPFFVQFGMGPHISPWTYEYYYDSVNYTDQSESSNGVGVNFGVMAAAGADFAISEKFNIFFLGKMDGIFRYGVMLPFTVNIGFSIDL